MALIDPRVSGPPAGWGVTVDAGAIRGLAGAWVHRDLDEPRYDYPGMPPAGASGWLDFCVLAVAVCGCLWAPEGSEMWATYHEGAWLDDAPGLFSCITRQGWEPRRYAELDDTSGRAMFAGRGVLQFVPDRVKRLREVGGALEGRWAGSAASLVEDAGWDGRRIVELLVGTIPGFDDHAVTPVGTVRFDKLAHLATAMMAARSDRPIGGIGDFPVFADYMVPRTLRHLGVLVYESGLGEAVDQRMLIPSGSTWEVAIRWATIRAGELIREALAARGRHLSTPRLDYALWSDAVLGPEAGAMGEHHRTPGLAY
ncbi:MAG: queuosine salvage family protein [Acidimicrobiia bacterium]|jgi:hypothetical protein